MNRKKELAQRDLKRLKRKKRIRGRIFGTAEFPRVSIFKSNRFIYAQAIDDVKGHTLAHVDGSALKIASNKDGAVKAAEIFAEKLKEAKIEQVKFDKNGYQYHGVVKAFADALRDNGIKL
jgi:large subunit ribosomal protein L18